MLLSELLTTAKGILNDAQSVTYTEADLIQGVNLACNAVSIHRPDASTAVGDIDLEAGTRQSLPAGGLRIIDSLGNSDEGSAARIVNRMDMETSAPGWRQETAAAEVREVMVDEKTPGVFWVSPPNDGNGRLELIWTTVPTPALVAGDELPVSDKYAPVVLEWLLYLMFARDSERSPNRARAQAHYQAFFQLLGIKTQTDALFSPNHKN